MRRLKKRQIAWLASLAILLGVSGVSTALQLASRPAEEWIPRLERSERVTGLKLDEVIPLLKLKPGDVVADIGAGSGVFARPLARAVTPSGKLLAVEIDQGFLDYIDAWAKEESIENIQTVLGKFDDPNLPTREVDVAFFHDVLHHVDHREAYLRALVSYLKPSGRVVIIDLIKDHPDTPHRDRPELQITSDDVKQWMAAAGFRPVEEFDLFDNKFFVVFARRP